ncbi:hypothetical protein [Apibacter adventoris]|uniref:RHS repeat-associated core domain-containing protein n=1 Tax=Apibacter adventoris TaxID=1679466 RepID=A0A2S8A9S7_9FLAO|nr:hypothetical protein [Apibacter adventoris]PQL91270.1 hypothetical protein C4S77_08400 [Apibacter adventoris]
MFEKTGTPYQYTYQNPIRYTDPTGMEGEGADDWIKKGNKIFFDPSANSENYKDKYGKDAILVDKHNIYDERGYISESYDFHSDGTYTYSTGVFSSNHSVYDVETHSISRSTIIEGLKCTSCPTIDTPKSTYFDRWDQHVAMGVVQGGSKMLVGYGIGKALSLGKSLFKARSATTALTEFWPKNGGALGNWETEYLMPGM